MYDIELNGIYFSVDMKYKASWWTQFRLLFWRSWIDNARSPAQSKARILQTVILSVVFCLLYYGQHYDQKGVSNIDGALFIFLLMLSFTYAYMVATIFPSEYPLFLREHDNGMYRVDTYYFARVLADLPIFIFNPLLFSTIMYYTVNFYPSATAFLTFVFALTMNSLCATALAHLLSTLTCNVIFTVALVSPVINIFYVTGGFFINVASIPWYMKPVQYISWFIYSFEILIINQWQNVDVIGCELAVKTVVNGSVTLDTSLCFNNGQDVIRSLSFSENYMTFDAVILVVLFILYETVGFFFLYWRSRQK